MPRRNHSRRRRRRRRRRRQPIPELVAYSSTEESASESSEEEFVFDASSDEEYTSETEDVEIQTEIHRCVVCEVVKTKKEHKNGGKRNTKSYMQKADCVDNAVIEEFIANVRYTCAKNCLGKLQALGKTGFQICKDLRQERFECECILRFLSSWRTRAIFPPIRYSCRTPTPGVCLKTKNIS